MTPAFIPGVTWVKGNMKPLTLVNTVINRNSAVKPPSLLDENMPNMTMSPDTMPNKLMITWTVVKVESDMPSIRFASSFPNRAEILRCGRKNFHKAQSDLIHHELRRGRCPDLPRPAARQCFVFPQIESCALPGR